MAFTTSSSRTYKPRRPIVPFLVFTLIGALAIASVTYLLWPTWTRGNAGDPDHLPVSIGGTLFNVPTKAVRVKLQKRSGPQERVDLAFTYPALLPPSGPVNVTAQNIDENIPPIDRLFLSIAAHHDIMAPIERMRTIYPRYLDVNTARIDDELTTRPFRDGTPYAGEDLVMAVSPLMAARCTRDAATEGMCLSERRVDGADLTFRFPRAWLAQWRDVAGAMERVTTNVHPR